MSERASLEELLVFANAVREAGGGNPIDALLPATPVDPNACLIAKNLNFNCEVNRDTIGWYMYVTDSAIREKIAVKLQLSTRTIDRGAYFVEEPGNHKPRLIVGIILPGAIGLIAEDFDNFASLAKECTIRGEKIVDNNDDIEFLALIEESYKETEGIGEFNDKNELLL